MPRIFSRKLFMKLMTLTVLGLVLVTVMSDQTARARVLDDCMTCDANFPICNGACGNDPECYVDCQTTYANCLYACNDDFSRTPILSPTAGCEANADRVRQYCNRGRISIRDREQYGNCMADGGNAGDCCALVASTFYEYCISQ